jgi:biotin carboxyl carrier protein
MANEKTLKLVIDGRQYDVAVGDLSASPVEVVVNGRSFSVDFAQPPPAAPAAAGGGETREAKSPAPRAPARAEPAAPGPAAAGTAIVSPMPGTIGAIRVTPGQRVRRGDVLCYLEAMKMNNAIHAPRDGVIKDVSVSEGQTVAYRQVLITYAD